MRLFHFYRVEDFSGVSGTGIVAEGVVFTNGWCAVRWMSSTSSIAFYQSLEEMKSIHGHGGRTEFAIHDMEPTKKTMPSQGGTRYDLLMKVIEEAANLAAWSEGNDATPEEILKSLAEIRSMLDKFEKKLVGSKKKSSSAA